jgi:UDP-N-acetylmuramoyl-tripeptide--D-alanyl-D-alanine ligase
MMKVIDFCGELKNVGKKIFVLADMKELGAESEKSHEAIGRRISEVCPEDVYLVGPEMKVAVKAAAEGQSSINVKWFNESSDKNFETIASDINLLAGDNDVILLKGSPAEKDKADAKKALKHSAEIYSAAGRKELAEKSLELLKSLE